MTTMPIVVEANFCKNGFEFAQQKQKGGSISACFHPVTLWFGKCTHGGEHSTHCTHYFNKKTFFLPLTVCHSVVSKLPISVQFGYIQQLTCAHHLAFFADRGLHTIKLACTQSMTRLIKSKNSINAKFLRRACRSSIVTRDSLLAAKSKMTATTPFDLLCMSLYLNFMFASQRMPYDFHARTFLMARATLLHYNMPPELQKIILSHVFSNSQGIYL